MSSSRKYLIAGNWKMNKNIAESVQLAEEINSEAGQTNTVQVCLCPPFVSLQAVAKVIESSNILLGAQNMHPEPSGAFTGEVSAEMLRHVFCHFVILGHSERRQYFGETDAFINTKVKAALESALRPILCVGETLEEREAGRTLEVVEGQLRAGLADIAADKADYVVIAYEPVWAIGTGKTATPEMAQEVHAMIRRKLAEFCGADAAGRIRILYGGSMKPENAEDLLKQPDIDGGLIGGASLKARSFLSLIETAGKRAE